MVIEKFLFVVIVALLSSMINFHLPPLTFDIGDLQMNNYESRLINCNKTILENGIKLIDVNIWHPFVLFQA